MMLPHIPAGYLADRIGRKPVMVAAWTFGLIAAWVMALARTLPVFIVGMLFYGLTAFVSAPMNSYITTARGKLSPARAMTLMSASFNLGAVLGPVSGGWLGERLGLRTVYLVAACIFILSTGILLLIHSQPCDERDPATPPARLWTNTRFITLVGIVFVTMFFMYLPQPLTPKFLQNERGLSLASIGVLGSVGSFGNAALNLILGHLAARTGFILAQVSVAAFSLLIWKGNGVPWYALGYFLLGGYRAALSFIFAQARPLVHPAQMGLAYGVAQTFNSLSMTLAPLLAGVLYTQAPVLVYPVSLGLVGLAILITIAFAPHPPVEELAVTSQSQDL
jgi:MFS family permease